MMRARGFTLIEVLITLVIFSIGLLSVAGLQTISKKANFDALQRTTASLLAGDIIERMRANARQLQIYNNNGSRVLGGGTQTAANPDCVSASCNQVQLANQDLFEWERSLDGANELVGAAFTGGLVQPTACIDGPVGGIGGVYTVAIAWRGVTALSNPIIHACGSDTGRYGDNNEFRRILVIETYITPTQ
jgi:type IV pilus assembly protein PilV